MNAILKLIGVSKTALWGLVAALVGLLSYQRKDAALDRANVRADKLEANEVLNKEVLNGVNDGVEIRESVSGMSSGRVDDELHDNEWFRD